MGAKKKYRVGFYYYTDCRVTWVGEASNSVSAIVLAQEALFSPVVDWCSYGKGFHITVEEVVE